MAKKIVVDCCRHCQFVDYLDELYPMDLQKCRPYCTYPELLQEYPNIEGKKIFQLVNGPTGYESFHIDSEYNHLDNVCENGWTACCGTKGVWDKLFIPAEEMKEALAPFLDSAVE